MPIHRYLEWLPTLGSRVYIAPGAQIVGRCVFADHVSIWHNCVVRADVNTIVIGENTNIQDLSMLHVTEINGLTIGKNVSVGHSVTLHGCKIGDSCLIAMGAIILDGAEIGDNCVVAGGSVIPPGKKFPAGSMIMGNPGKVVRDLSPEEKNRWANHYKSYLGYKDQYLAMEAEDRSKE